MSPPRLLAFSALVVALLGALVFSLWPVSDEDRVKEAVSEVVTGAREADLGAILGPISDDYVDGDGLTKDMLRGYLFREFRSRGPIGVHRGPISATVEGGKATATFDAVVVEGVAGSVIPTDADAWSVTVSLRNIGGDWLITGHTRRPLEEGWRLPEPDED